MHPCRVDQGEGVPPVQQSERNGVNMCFTIYGGWERDTSFISGISRYTWFPRQLIQEKSPS